MNKKRKKKHSKKNNITLFVVLAISITILICLAILFVNQECKHIICEKTTYKATCQDKGYTNYLCKKCGFEFDADYIAPLGHDYIENIINPTCEEQGYTEHVCTKCNDVFKDNYVASNGHTYNSSITLPSCISEGYTTYACENCELNYITDYTAPIDHQIVSQTVSPSCLEQGYTVNSCKNCTYGYVSDFTEPKGHSEKLSIVLPTCEDAGYSLFECENCDYKYTKNDTSPLGHNYVSVITEPTCQEQGYTTKTCTVCQHQIRANPTAPRGHSIISTTFEPDCQNQGYTLNQCKNCSYYYINNYTSVLLHTYEKTYVRPNIQQTGYTINTCTACGSESISDYVWYTDIFTGAEGDGKGEIAWGLDLSHHSQNVDFNLLKSKGIDFVILRIGYDDVLDSKFESYYFAAKEAGLDVGVYFFTYAYNANDAKKDAKQIVDWIAEIETRRGVKMQFEYPIFYDIEDVNVEGFEQYLPSAFSKQQLRSIIYTFMTEMVNYNYYPGLYTNNNLLYNVFHTEETLVLYDIWYARYAPNDNSATIDQFVDKNIINFSSTYSIWQYMGDVSGFAGAVSGKCDVNFAFKNYPAHIKKYGFNGY